MQLFSIDSYNRQHACFRDRKQRNSDKKGIYNEDLIFNFLLRC